jgi:outer membrane lipoprotein
MSEDLRTRVDETVDLRILFKEPEQFTGKTVIMGGVIVSARNEETGSFIEILQKPLDSRGIPEDTDRSYGRFVAFSKGFLDKDMYSRGRRVTVGGVVSGTVEGTIGEMKYDYPTIEIEEIRLHKTGRDMPVFFSIGVGHSF